MKAKWKLNLLAISAVVLSACSSVANQSPDEMYRHSIQRQFKQDSQYNFTGKISFNVLPEIHETARQTSLDKLLESEKRKSEWLYSDEPEMQTPAKIRERAQNRLDRTDMMTAHFINHVSLPFTGAYDLPNGKFEVVPELRYETRNAISSVKLPILIDAKNASLIVDPAAVSPFIDASADKFGKNAQGELINNRYIRMTAPNNLRNKFPIKDLFMTFPKALDEGYMVYDKSAFTALPLNERAKKLGATHRIGIKSTPEQDDKVATAIVNSIIEQLQQKQKEGTAQGNVKAEDYARFIDALKTVNKETPDENLSEAQKALKNITVDGEAYFNNQGRMLSYVQAATLPDYFSEKWFDGKKIRVQYEVDMSYNKQPTFVIQPNATNTVDLKDVFPEWHKKWSNAFDSVVPNDEVETVKEETSQSSHYLDWKK